VARGNAKESGCSTLVLAGRWMQGKASFFRHALWRWVVVEENGASAEARKGFLIVGYSALTHCVGQGVGKLMAGKGKRLWVNGLGKCEIAG
jgi:hypothetical protein